MKARVTAEGALSFQEAMQAGRAARRRPSILHGLSLVERHASLQMQLQAPVLLHGACCGFRFYIKINLKRGLLHQVWNFSTIHASSPAGESFSA